MLISSPVFWKHNLLPSFLPYVQVQVRSGQGDGEHRDDPSIDEMPLKFNN